MAGVVDAVDVAVDLAHGDAVVAVGLVSEVAVAVGLVTETEPSAIEELRYRSPWTHTHAAAEGAGVGEPQLDVAAVVGIS